LISSVSGLTSGLTRPDRALLPGRRMGALKSGRQLETARVDGG